MKKSLTIGLVAMTIGIAAPVFAAGPFWDRLGDRIDRRLDARGERRDDRLDARGGREGLGGLHLARGHDPDHPVLLVLREVADEGVRARG